MNEIQNNWGSERFSGGSPDPQAALGKRNLRLVLIAFAIGWPVAGVLLWTAYHLGVREDMFGSGPEVAFVIAPGESARSVASRLADEDIVGSAFLFRVWAKLSGTDDDLKPGTYQLRQGSGVETVIDTLIDGHPREQTITMIEGWTIRDMASYLVQKKIIEREADWYAIVGTPPGVAPALSAEAELVAEFPWLAALPAGATLEGFLFPDTYRLSAEAESRDVARLMLQTFERKADPARLANSRLGLFGSVTLASILEREVRGAVDSKKVADLFLRRLDEGMALQADATVNYVTGKGTAAISLNDRDIDSPWNTYKYPGLPVGPISNPGSVALDAVLHPDPNTAWYYLTDADGNVHYAITHDAHVANKERYLR